MSAYDTARMLKEKYLSKPHVHTFYQLSDFTAEEIARQNVLAVAVLDEGRSICKYCGEEETTPALTIRSN